jgi:hypothetical protein
VTHRFSALTLAALCGAAFVIAAPAVAADSQRPLTELRCDLMESTPQGRMSTIEAPDLHVLQQTSAAGRFSADIPEGTAGIMCGRSSILPAAHDDEVIYLGVPLFIAETGSPGRLGVLEIDQGRYRFRMLEGRLSADEQAAIDRRLDEYQRRIIAQSSS